MSTTHSQSQPLVQMPQDPLDRFDELLFENEEICSHCYARLRDKDEHDTDRLGTGNRPTETLERTGEGTLGQDVLIHGAHGAQRSFHPRTYCGTCGSNGGRARGDHCHSLQDLRGIADNIVRRLHEMGYYPDVSTLYQTVNTLKRKPEHQQRDRQILATAVHLALDRGDEAPDVPDLVWTGDEEPIRDEHGVVIDHLQVPFVLAGRDRS